MFGNFLYYITALLIYVSATEGTKTISGDETALPSDPLVFFLILAFLFVFTTWIQFKHFEKRISRDDFPGLDRSFNAILSRQSLGAIIIFAIQVYGLKLPQLLSGFSVFSTFSTIQAAVVLGIFLGYLAILWALAYNSYRRLYLAGMSRKSYIWSNLSFAVVLAPWFLLSLILDLIGLLPFQSAKNLVSTNAGQILSFLIFLLIVLFVYPFLIRLFWRCKPLESGPARQRIEALCAEAGMTYSNILYWPIFGGRMITAGVMGLFGKCRYILVTQALLTYLEPEEVDAVIAHEIGHIKKKHLVLLLFLFMGFFLLLNAFELPLWVIQTYFVIYAGRLCEWLGGSNSISGQVSDIFGLILIVTIFMVYFRYLFGYFMRNFERQADTYVFSMFKSAAPLISTFGKIVKTSGLPADRPNWHHFSISERVDYLGKCETDRTWITKQDRKIKKSVWVYFVGLCVLGVAIFAAPGNDKKNDFRLGFMDDMVDSVIRDGNPDAWKLASELGDIYYSYNKFEKTIEVYEKALGLNPDATNVLNNLAWLHATCDDERFRNPARALELAQRAVALSEEPHIVDTLAESYYVNGLFEDAVRTEERALGLVKLEKDKGFYKERVEKFREALKESGK